MYEAAIDCKVDPDNESLASTFVSVSPTPSISSTAFDGPDDLPPPYSAVASGQGDGTQSWTARDPRSSSTQSLGTTDVAQTGRRKLLLVYIHGFMGNETSFQGFPAHVHNLVTVLLSSSHVVRTKVYPRYRSKKAIQVATEDFSRWLEPHESPDTDVVLLGHSMGGLLCAEVVLLPARNPTTAQPLRHRIVGTIGFDTPFLGMHPGIIKAGLGSIFSPAPKTPASARACAAPSYLTSLVDGFSNLTSQNYNPSFANDVNLPARKGWDSALHFVNKHSKNLRQATTQLITSHVEFGSCLADYEGLKIRYCRIRMLEEDEANKRRTVSPGGNGTPPRVRFTNYYTASTGRPKKPNPPSREQSSNISTLGPDSPVVEQSGSDLASPEPDQYHTNLATLDNVSLDNLSETSSLSSLADLDTVEDSTTDPASTVSSPTTTEPPPPNSLSTLSPLPPPPTPPGPGPVKQFFLDDVDAFKYAYTTYRADVKAYAIALKAYHHLLIAHKKAEHDQYYRDTNANWKAAALDAKASLNAYKQNTGRGGSPDSAKSAAERRADAKAEKERRKREFETMRDQLKKQFEDEKARRKSVAEAAKAERKAGKQALKVDRKAEKEQLKSAYNARKAEYKEANRGCGPRNDIAPRPGIGGGESSTSRSSTSTSTSTATTTARPSIASPSSSGYGFPPEKQRSLSTSASADSTSTPTTDVASSKPKKDRKFCILPPADSTGARDPTWQRVYMTGVDEVGAHCGLFFPQGAGGEEVLPNADGMRGDEWGERYARLVGDVAERVEGWVLDCETERLVREAGGV